MNITFRNASKTTIAIHGLLSLAYFICVVIGGFFAIVCLIDYAKTGAMPSLYWVARFGGAAIGFQLAMFINMLATN